MHLLIAYETRLVLYYIRIPFISTTVVKFVCELPDSLTRLKYVCSFMIAAYDEFSEAFNFAPQTGVWEVRHSHDPAHKMINRQVILHKPVYWCDTKTVPLSIGGDYSW